MFLRILTTDHKYHLIIIKSIKQGLVNIKENRIKFSYQPIFYRSRLYLRQTYKNNKNSATEYKTN